MNKTVQFSLNDKPVKMDAEADQSLLWFLRQDMELTGTKYGCGVGLCGGLYGAGRRNRPAGLHAYRADYCK